MTAILSENDLSVYTRSADLSTKAHALLQQQKATWDVLRGGYGMLDSIQLRTLRFDGFDFRLQFNTRRITSSAAKVDPKSIAERKCFLCPANLPSEQRGLTFADRYLVLCNPFPIFPEHFTVVDKSHVDQRILPRFGDMLDLAEAMSARYTVFYNGPRCGASAPDHFHFQAGNKGFMPIDTEYDLIKESLGRKLIGRRHLTAYAVGTDKYARCLVGLESDSRQAMMDAFHAFYTAFAGALPGYQDEPMLNILASQESGVWRAILFPRAKHRPACFFAEGDAKMVLSPASVDFGGVFVTPIEKDFHRVDKAILRQVFEEVCVTPDVFADLNERLVKAL